MIQLKHFAATIAFLVALGSAGVDLFKASPTTFHGKALKTTLKLSVARTATLRLIKEVAEENEIPAGEFAALVWIESRFDPQAKPPTALRRACASSSLRPASSTDWLTRSMRMQISRRAGACGRTMPAISSAVWGGCLPVACSILCINKVRRLPSTCTSRATSSPRRFRLARRSL